MDEVATIGVYDAVSIGVVVTSVNDDSEGDLSLTVMQREGGPDGGYRDVTNGAWPHIPVHVARGNLEVEMADELPTEDNFGDVKTHWDAEDGGPYEVRKKNGGIVVREWGRD